jgi:hypothetical protein
MGEIVDTAVLDKDTLTLRKRTVKQGPVTIEFEVADNKATGKMNMGGQDRPISVDLGGPLFADAAGAMQAIACLPIKEGYSTTFRNLDLQKQKPKLMQLQVAGSESVTVPAGTFNAYKIEVTSADGGPDKMTVWVATESRKAVKYSAVLSQMGGATLTAELMQ